MNTAKTGGILKGKKHSQCDHNGCGIKTVAGSVHKEAEGGEFLLSAAPLKSNKVITLQGTKREIAEQINGKAGIIEGKQTLHVDAGQYVINAKAMTEPYVFNVTGTPLQIASAINADKGYGIEFAPGATITPTTLKLLGRDMKIKKSKLEFGGPVTDKKIGFDVKKFKNNNEAWNILDNSKAGDSADWMTGGCLILADAFNIAFGYPVYAIYNEDKKLIDHFVVKTPSGNYIDADGERKNIIDSFAKQEMITDQLKLVKFTSDMPIGEIPQDKNASKKLAEILKENINSSTKNIMATRKKSSRKTSSKKLSKGGSTSSLADKSPLQRKLIIELRAIHDLQFDFSNAGSMDEIMQNNEVTYEEFTGKPSGLDLDEQDAGWVMFNDLWKKIMYAADNLTDEQITEFYENGNGQYFDEELTDMEVDLTKYEADDYVQFTDDADEKSTTVTPATVAKEFSRLLRETITPAQMGEAIALNKTPEYTSACATHNYCDSNQVMLDAFENIAGRPYSFDDDSTDQEITDKAWDIAREHDFYPQAAEITLKNADSFNVGDVVMLPTGESGTVNAIADGMGNPNIIEVEAPDGERFAFARNGFPLKSKIGKWHIWDNENVEWVEFKQKDKLSKGGSTSAASGFVITNTDRTKFIGTKFNSTDNSNEVFWTDNIQMASVYETEAKAEQAEDNFEDFIGNERTYLEPLSKFIQPASIKAGALTSVIPYDEEQYGSLRDYLSTIITNAFGPENDYPGSADWGGIPVWGINGDMYEGDFIIIDDNDNVILMNRVTPEDEDFIDTDIERVDINSYPEFQSDPSGYAKGLLHLLQTAWSMKKSGKKLAKGGPTGNTELVYDKKTTANIKALEDMLASPATPANQKASIQASLDKLKATGKPAEKAPEKTPAKPAKPDNRKFSEMSKLIKIGSNKRTSATNLAIKFYKAVVTKIGEPFSVIQTNQKHTTKLKWTLLDVTIDDEDSPVSAGIFVQDENGTDTQFKLSEFDKAVKLVTVSAEAPNLMPLLKSKYAKSIDDYGITQAHMVDNELNLVSDYEVPNDLATAMEAHLKGQKGPEKGQKKAPVKETKSAQPDHSGKTGSDLVTFVDKEIDAVIGKTIYFKASNFGKWITGKIEAIEPFDKAKEHWNIEFYPVGGAKKFDAPMVSDKLTTKQIDEFIHGSEVKKYTLTKPQSEVIKDFEAAAAEIDICHEEAKAKRVDKQRKNPPVKKKPSEILKNKVSSYHGYAIKRVEKKDPKRVTGLKKLLERHKKEVDAYIAGKK